MARQGAMTIINNLAFEGETSDVLDDPADGGMMVYRLDYIEPATKVLEQAKITRAFGLSIQDTEAKIKTIEYDVDLPEKAGVFILFGLSFLLIEFFISKFLIPSVS